MVAEFLDIEALHEFRASPIDPRVSFEWVVTLDLVKFLLCFLNFVLLLCNEEKNLTELEIHRGVHPLLPTEFRGRGVLLGLEV